MQSTQALTQISLYGNRFLARPMNTTILRTIMLFSLLMPACGPSKTWHKATLFYFDTICEVNLYCSQPEFVAAQDALKRTFTLIHDRFSPGSNDFSSPEVLTLFAMAQDVYAHSNGAFDISVAPLSQVWDIQSEAPRIPSPQEVKAALKFIGLDRIQIKEGSLVLPPGFALDWGGVAKGYGIDMAAQMLMQMEIPRGFVNAGGDLFCWGDNPEAQPWQVGVKHPRQQGFLGILSLSALGAATTGDYQRFFLSDGIRYHHIFDPKNGYPARGKQSVTVVGPSTSLCDALATALFVSHAPETILEHYPDYGAILVDADGILSFLGRPLSFEPFF